MARFPVQPAFRHGRAGSNSGFATALLALCLSGPAIEPSRAQQQPPTPGTVRAPLERSPQAPAPVAPAPSNVPERSRSPVPAGREVSVERFVLSGNTVFSDETLLAAIGRFQDRALTIEQIYEVADALSDFYREHGFDLATVIVPPQEVTGGTIRLEVIESRLDRIDLQGNALYSSDFLVRRLSTLKTGSVIRSDALRRQVLLLSDLPGLHAHAVIRPGTRYGTSNILIQAAERRFEGSVRLNNFGRESLGEWRINADAAANNPLGLGDRLHVSLLHAEGGRMDYGAIDYSIAVGSRGTRAGFSLGRFHYSVDTTDLGLAPFTLSGDGTDVGISLSQPIIRTRARNLVAGVELAHHESAQAGTLVVGGRSSFVNLLGLSAQLSLYHSGAVTYASARFSTNLTHNSDGTKNNAQAGKLALEASHERRLTGPWSVVARANAVLSADPLLDLERYRIGGPGSVRGFPSAELAGDRGFSFGVQLNRRVAVHESVRGTARVFFDAGKVYRDSDARRVTGESASASLTSIGAGITLRGWDRYALELEAAVPTNSRNATDGRNGARIWARVSTSY